MSQKESDNILNKADDKSMANSMDNTRNPLSQSNSAASPEEETKEEDIEQEEKLGPLQWDFPSEGEIPPSEDDEGDAPFELYTESEEISPFSLTSEPEGEIINESPKTDTENPYFSKDNKSELDKKEKDAKKQPEGFDMAMEGKPNEAENEDNKVEVTAFDMQGSTAPSAGSFVMDQWTLHITDDTANVPDPDLTLTENAPEELNVEGEGLEAARINQGIDYNESIESAIESLPETENEPILDTGLIGTQVDSIISPFKNRLLPDQELPTLRSTPGGIVPRLGDSVRLVTLENEIRNLESVVNDEMQISTESSEPSENEIRLEALRQQANQLLPEAIPEGEEERIILEDHGEPVRPELPEGLQANMGDVIARLLANPRGEAGRMLTHIRKTAFPHEALHGAFPNIGEEEIPGLTDLLRGELHDIAEEAGLSEEQLQQKISEQVQFIEEREQMSMEGLERNLITSQEALENIGADETSTISGLRECTDSHIQEQEDALEGNVNPEEIENQVKEIRKELNKGVGNQKAEYDRSKTRRHGQLDDSKRTYFDAYRAAALREQQSLEQNTNEEGSDSNRGSVEGIRVWREARIAEITSSTNNLKREATNTIGTYKTELDNAKASALERLEEWQTEKLGTQKSWWDRLIDAITDWANTATGQAEVWHQVNIQESQDALAGNIDFLETARQQLGDNVTAEGLEAIQGLSEEQRAILETYYGNASGDSIGAVAAGMRVRLREQHRSQIEARFMDFLLNDSSARRDWTRLNAIALTRNSSFNAISITNELNQAMNGGVTGIGTDEARVFRALSGLSQLEGIVVRVRYKEVVGLDLDQDILEELGDAELDRAQALLNGDNTTAVVAEIEEAMDGIGVDEDVIMRVLRGKSAEERAAIMRIYEEKYDGNLNEVLEDELDGNDLDRANALMEGDTNRADAIALEEAMNGGLFGWGTDRDEIDATYTQIRQDAEQEVNRRTAEIQAQAARENWSSERIMAEMEARGCTSEQLDADISRRNQNVENSFNDQFGDNYELEDGESALRAEFEDELSGGELNLANALADNDQTGIDAGRIAVETESLWYTDDDQINSILENQHSRALREMRRDEWPIIQQELNERARREGWDSYRIRIETRNATRALEERARPQALEYMNQLEETYDEARGNQGNLRIDLLFTTSGTDRSMAYDLLDSGSLTPVEQLEYAMDGLGTDEERINQALEGKTQEEIAEIKEQWTARNGGTLEDALHGDLSGRDEFDTDMLLRGIPRNRQEELENMQDRVAWEESNDSWISGGGDELDVLRQDLEYIEEQHRILNDSNASEEEKAIARLVFGTGTAGIESGIDVYREQSDAVASAASTAISIGAGLLAAAVLPAAAPLIAAALNSSVGLALSSALGSSLGVALGSSVVATTASIITKRIMLGNAYGNEALFLDAGVGVVDLISAGAFSNLGANILKRTAIAELASSPNLLNRVLAHVIVEGGSGAISAAPSSLAGGVFNDDIWENENAFTNIVTGTLIGMGTSLGVGVGKGIGLGFGNPSTRVGDVSPNNLDTDIPDVPVNVNVPEPDVPVNVNVPEPDIPANVNVPEPDIPANVNVPGNGDELDFNNLFDSDIPTDVLADKVLELLGSQYGD